MGMGDYKKAAALIKENEGDADFVGPRSEELVRKAEAALNLRFPPTYRRFLLEYGAGDFGGEEFFGVIKDDFQKSSVPDAIWCTLGLRRKIGLPADLVVIGETEEGGLCCLEIKPDGGEGRVVTVDPADLSSRKKAARDFGEYLLDRVEEAEE